MSAVGERFTWLSKLNWHELRDCYFEGEISKAELDYFEPDTEDYKSMVQDYEEVPEITEVQYER